MVHPTMRETHEAHSNATNAAHLAAPITSMMPNLHSIVIGPGLGRDTLMQDTVAEVIKAARESNIPLVLDADALWLIQQRPDLIKGYKECVLTPNVVEFARLAKAVGVDSEDKGEDGCHAVARALGGVLIVRKGPTDWICDGSSSLESTLEGGLKRSGGQGDTLTGSIGTFLAWRGLYLQGLWDTEGGMSKEETLRLAAYGGSAITRECSRLAFKKRGRALQASDLTEEVEVAFNTLIGEPTDSKL